MKSYKKKGIVFLAVMLAILIAHCSYSSVAFYHYGTEQGLNEASVIDIEQDSSGFIWLAGNYSLTRFDGKEFVEFVHVAQKPLPWKKINEIFIDNDGVLWIASAQGFSFYDLKSDEFVEPVDDWEITVNDISESDAGILLLATGQGLAMYEKSNKKVTWITGPNTVFASNDSLKSLINLSHVESDQQNNVWLSNFSEGLFRVNTKNGNLAAFQQIDGFPLHKLQISHHAINNGKLFISTVHHGFLEVDIKRQKVRQFKFDVDVIAQHFYIESDSAIWLATDNGLINLNPQTEEFVRYTNIPIDPLSMTRTAVSHVILDKNKNLWVSNSYRGVELGLNVMFNHMMYAEHDSYTVTDKEVTALDSDNDGAIWVGYESGLIEKNSPGASTKQKYYLISPETGKTSGSVFKVFEDSKGRTWAGGWVSGLFQLNESRNKFQKATIKPESMAELLKNADIRDITEDKNGNLWITAHAHGLVMYNPENGRAKLYRFIDDAPSSGISNNYTYNMCFDADDNLWISSAHGVTRMDVENEKFTTFFHDPNDSLSLSSNNAMTIICDASDNTWVGTDNGLSVFIPELNKLQPVSTEYDFKFMAITSLESVRKNEIWASTRSGLCKVIYEKNTDTNLIEAEIEYYFQANGLISNVYFDRSSTVSDNTLFFGGNHGVDFFIPYEESSKNKIPPEVVVTQTSVYGKPINSGTGDDNQANLVLSHDQKMVSFRFTAPNFINPEQQKYRYMLADFDNQWVYTQDERVATYTNLPPGDFTFKVEVTDKNGNWRSNQNGVLNLRVRPPFWKTIPFILLTISGILALFFLYQRLRYRAMRKRQLELVQTVHEKTRELQNKNRELQNANRTKNKFFSIISHDLRSPFAGLLGILELLNDPDYLPEDQKKSLVKSAYQTAQNTFSLLENLLAWAHSQTKRIEFAPEDFNLAELLDKNIQLGKEVANQKGIRINKEFDEDLSVFGDVNMIDTVVRNIVNNAIKFTENGGHITVKATDSMDKIAIRIADTGIGMTPEQRNNLFDLQTKSSKGTNGENGTGLGLVIGKEFILKNKGEIWATKNSPRGTVFHFTIPKARQAEVAKTA